MSDTPAGHEPVEKTAVTYERAWGNRWVSAEPPQSISAFLFARYDEDESIARDVRHQALSGRPFIAITAGGTGVRRLTDPSWWLEDLAAKREIVEWHGEHLETATHGRPCRTLRLLAGPYAGHPDYREEWKP
jgi:hypothetical protein